MIKGSISLSEIGKCRYENQDAVLAEYTGQTGIFLVADGMGGHDRGDLASQMAASHFRAWWEEIQGFVSSILFADVVSELEREIERIHREIYERYCDLGLVGGSTLCMMFLHQRYYAVWNVGDSRAYLCRGRELIRLTTDDVWENRSENRLYAKPEDIHTDIRYGRLTQALGAQRQVRVQTVTGQMQKGDCFFLCSDGIYKYCDDDELKTCLKKIRNMGGAQTAVKRIRQRVYEGGARDNLSMLLVLIGRSIRER